MTDRDFAFEHTFRAHNKRVTVLTPEDRQQYYVESTSYYSDHPGKRMRDRVHTVKFCTSLETLGILVYLAARMGCHEEITPPLLSGVQQAASGSEPFRLPDEANFVDLRLQGSHLHQRTDKETTDAT